MRMTCIPGLEPDAPIRSKLRFVNGVLDLRQFDKIFISVSGGKDSHAMLFLVRDLADRQGVLRSKLLALYADTGMEWHNAGEHVQALCKAAGIELVIVRPEIPMIEKVRYHFDKTKGSNPFPSMRCRWCTSEQKTHPMDKIIVKYHGTLLKVTGERKEESVRRSVLPEFGEIRRTTCKTRTVFGWRPMLNFTTDDVWAMIKDSGVPRHFCYDIGCDRLGCAGCIFNNDRQVKIEMRENPLIFEAIDQLETETGYTMSIKGIRIRDRVKKA